MSPHQFLVVSLLLDGPLTGPELRRRMAAAQVPITPPSFSRLIRRMRKAAYLSADSVQTPAGRRLVWPRRYRLTDLGIAVWTRTRDTYAAAPVPSPDPAVVVTGDVDLADLPSGRRRQLRDERFERQLNARLNRLLKVYLRAQAARESSKR